MVPSSPPDGPRQTGEDERLAHDECDFVPDPRYTPTWSCFGLSVQWSRNRPWSRVNPRTPVKVAASREPAATPSAVVISTRYVPSGIGGSSPTPCPMGAMKPGARRSACSWCQVAAGVFNPSLLNLTAAFSAQYVRAEAIEGDQEPRVERGDRLIQHGLRDVGVHLPRQHQRRYLCPDHPRRIARRDVPHATQIEERVIPKASWNPGPAAAGWAKGNSSWQSSEKTSPWVHWFLKHGWP